MFLGGGEVALCDPTKYAKEKRVRTRLILFSDTIRDHPFLNSLFTASFFSCAYFYILTMLEDPGYVPKSGSRSHQKTVMEELLELWQFDEQHFCVNCMIRTPLRSKHCRRCKRCVAKHDQ